MQKWRPLIASLVVIALALGGMAVWKFAGSEPARVNSNSEILPEDAGSDTGSDDGFEWVSTMLEDLPPLDPLGLWPRDGQRIASAEFNVMWETTDHADCRLLVSTDRRDWYSMGHTGGKLHFLPVNFGDFDSELSFAVEFDFQGKRYRSAARTIRYGHGARFGQREYRFIVRNNEERFSLGVEGRDPADLPQSAFLTGWFPPDLGTGFLPGAGEGGDTKVLMVSNADVFENHALGWLEMYDAAADTYDRVLIHLGR